MAAGDRPDRRLPGRDWLSELLSGLVIPSRVAQPTVAEAVEWFFEDRDLANNTRRAYRQVHQVLIDRVGGMTPLDHLTSEKVREVLESEWGDAAPATFNARRTAIKSLTDHCREQGWMDHDPVGGIERRDRRAVTASDSS